MSSSSSLAFVGGAAANLERCIINRSDRFCSAGIRRGITLRRSETGGVVRSERGRLQTDGRRRCRALAEGRRGTRRSILSIMGGVLDTAHMLHSPESEAFIRQAMQEVLRRRRCSRPSTLARTHRQT